MDAAPKGPLALPLYLLEGMVSRSQAFQRAVGASGNPLAARSRIHLDDGEESDIPGRPFAAITTSSAAYSLIAGGCQNWLRPRGGLFLFLAIATPAELLGDRRRELFHALEFFGCVAEDVAELAAADQPDDPLHPDSWLALTSIELVEQSRTPRQEWESVGRFWWAAFNLQWGDA